MDKPVTPACKGCDLPVDRGNFCPSCWGRLPWDYKRTLRSEKSERIFTKCRAYLDANPKP